METRNCQNCKKDFDLNAQDLNLLDKFSLPLPSFCTECQMIERMLWRNERTLFKRKNDALESGNMLISIYEPNSDIVVYDSKSWWGDSWDFAGYGQDYDFSVPFFTQFSELIKKVPFPSLQNWNAVNSDYCNCTSDNKNCYMVFGGDFNEDSFYSLYNIYCKNVCDVYWLEQSEFCYELIVSEKCYKVKHGMYVRDCTDSDFIYDCVNCSNCLGCVCLRNKSYSILNVQYSKEEYFKVKDELKLNTNSGIENFKKLFLELKNNFPVKFAYLVKTQNVTGDRITNSKDCINCFDIVGPAENLKDCYNSGYNSKDMLRASHAGYGAELIYNSFGVFSSAQKVICSAYTPSSVNVSYSYNCPNGSNLFGCVGVKKGNYVILNKLYTKEEYQRMVPKIIQHMIDMPYVDSKGRIYSYGDFFPGEFSMFSYNDSVAQDWKTLTEEEIIEAGFRYNSHSHNSHAVDIKNDDIPDSLLEDFVFLKNKVIECANKGGKVYCSEVFRVTAEEFSFYKQMNLPLPKFCFNCRNYERFDQIRSMTLRKKSCDCGGKNSKNNLYTNTAVHSHEDQECSSVFETALGDNIPIIYCEECYKKEIL